MYQKVVGSRVLIFGDLHFSDVFTGKHKNYLKNCFDVLAMIRDKVNELQPSAVVFLGDIVGWNEGNVRNREVLYQLCNFFMDLNKVCKVYCVRGNHDFNGSCPEFQFLSQLGLFETSVKCDGFFDFYGEEGQEVPEVRFHLMDYGSEGMQLNLAKDKNSNGDGTTNIVLAHNNFTIEGVTTWYNEHDGIELGTMENLDGVFMLVSGHIHNPSPAMVRTSTLTGGDCCLFYPGCPTRPIFDKNLYTSVWYMMFWYDENSKETCFDAYDFPLAPIDEVFYKAEEFVEEKTEEELAELERTEALKEVLDDIIKCRITQGDLIGQVRAVPNATEEAKETAVKYLQIAMDSRAPASK